MNYASWGNRVVAYVVDMLVAMPFMIPAVIVEQRDRVNWISVTLTLLGTALYGYNRWFRAGRTGQSWGRQLVGARLVGAATGRPIGAFKAFVRDFAHLLDDIILYIGYLFPLWTAKRQCIADMVMRTVVVR